MAIVLHEAKADACIGAIAEAPELVISAATVAEALIVAGRTGLGDRMQRLIDQSGFEIVSVTPAESARVAAAYARWGKGVHPARLNFGDCFAYALAKARDCRLLYIGDDFRRTDIESVL